MAGKSNNILSVKKLTKSYEKKKVVDGISFEVKKGEIFGILGPNGAGKTTTLEMIEGLREIDEGSVKVAGIEVSGDPTPVQEIIGVQLQSTSFFDLLTLKELLQMFGAMYHQNIDVDELLQEVQLVEKKNSYVTKLSGGQRQRFSVAAALVNQPKVLFLDEPTTGLDPQARRNLWELIEAIKKKGITVVLTTHYMDEAEKLCDRIAIMDEGKIVALDTPTKMIKQLLKRGFKKEVEVHEADLEDVFIDLTGKDLRE
ncbi:MAG: ABC transporter ATP-binding protein [Candidatus Saccharimonadales bacterium]|nr:ABC transporter ATP-binding protein [Candidatus Saccharimonadales bacterium]